MLTSLAQISNKDLQTMCWERRTDDTSAFIDTLMVPDAPSSYELLNLFTEALTDMLTGRHRVVYTNSNSYESFHINSDGEVVLFTLHRAGHLPRNTPASGHMITTALTRAWCDVMQTLRDMTGRIPNRNLWIFTIFNTRASRVVTLSFIVVCRLPSFSCSL